eukprot:COSAG01_NODE_4470_length_4997_cov_5.849326_5_plen_79_part_00
MATQASISFDHYLFVRSTIVYVMYVKHALFLDLATHIGLATAATGIGSAVTPFLEGFTGAAKTGSKIADLLGMASRLP